MSTAQTLPSLDVTGTKRVPFLRLVRVELRKLTDTRAGRWLMGITFGILVLVTGVILLVGAFQDELTLTLTDWQGVFTFLVSLLLPIIAIMSVTQEWGQRTALTTFALEPHRLRVVLAKLTAVVGLALLALVFAGVLAVIANAALSAITGSTADWTFDWGDLGWSVFLQLAYFLMAFGFGALFLSTPVAIVLYYVVAILLPQMVWGIIYFVVSWGPDVVPWFDLGFAVAAYREQLPPPMDATPPDLGVGPIIVSTFIWVVLPFILGVRRIGRTELK